MLYLPKKGTNLEKYWVIDIEGDSLQPTVIWCVCATNLQTGAERSLVGHEEIRKWFKGNPSDTVYVGHNALSFDVPQLNRLLGLSIPVDNVVDTLVLSYLYHPHLPGGHSLKAWGERFKFPKDDFKDFSKFSQEMLTYCQQDVRVTVRVFRALVDRMNKIGFSELSCWIEHRARVVIDKQQAVGFSFDVKRAERAYGLLRRLEDQLTAYIHEVFPPKLEPVLTYKYRLKADGTPFSSYDRHVAKYPKLVHHADGTYTVFEFKEFNIGSPKQRVERLLDLGWTPKKFTKPSKTHPKGQPQVDEESLVAFAETSQIPEVGAIAKWLVVNGRANMIRTWLAATGPDGRIHGTVFSCGAITRRMRHNAPNTANIPGNEARFGRLCRSLWRATPGRLLVGYDAAALEMRMFGHYLGNKKAADLYIYGDPHTANTDALTAALGVTFVRKDVKTDFYAFLYGASNKKLGAHYGKSAQFGKKIRETLIENTPGLEKLAKRIEVEAESGFIQTVDGGYVRVLSSHAALNSKLQSAGGIAMKLAALLLDQKVTELGLDAWKVGDIHDEAQWDCHPDCAEQIGQLALECLAEAGVMLNLSVPLAGEFKTGRNWSETH